MLSEIATVVAGRNVCRCSKRDFVGYRQTTTSSGVRYYLSSDHLGSTATIVESTDLAHPVDVSVDIGIELWTSFGEDLTLRNLLNAVKSARSAYDRAATQDGTGPFRLLPAD